MLPHIHRTGSLAILVILLILSVAPSATGAGRSARVRDLTAGQVQDVSLLEFTATVSGSDVLLFWRTGSEDVETIFRIIRENEDTGVTAQILEMPGSGGASGAKYEHLDTGVPAGSYTYILYAYGEPGSPPAVMAATAMVEPPTSVELVSFGAK